MKKRVLWCWKAKREQQSLWIMTFADDIDHVMKAGGGLSEKERSESQLQQSRVSVCKSKGTEVER